MAICQFLWWLFTKYNENNDELLTLLRNLIILNIINRIFNMKRLLVFYNLLSKIKTIFLFNFFFFVFEKWNICQNFSVFNPAVERKSEKKYGLLELKLLIFIFYKTENIVKIIFLIQLKYWELNKLSEISMFSLLFIVLEASLWTF